MNPHKKEAIQRLDKGLKKYLTLCKKWDKTEFSKKRRLEDTLLWNQ